MFRNTIMLVTIFLFTACFPPPPSGSSRDANRAEDQKQVDEEFSRREAAEKDAQTRKDIDAAVERNR